MGMVLRQGHHFVEIYHPDRWYNIFGVHDREDVMFKGWYWEVGCPAVLEAVDRLSFVDPELDLWVTPDGSRTVLDEDEFVGLSRDGETRRQAEAAREGLESFF